MTTAKLCLLLPGAGVEVIITHGSGVQTIMPFRSESAARHYFLDQLGWYEDQGAWYDHESLFPCFVPVPRCTHGDPQGFLQPAGEYPIAIWSILCSTGGIPGTFNAFYYQVAGVGLVDFDPILSIASPLPLRIGAVGAWPSTFVAVEAAQSFYNNLLENYGHEYFRRVVDENIRRELRAHEAGLEVSVDASTAESVG